MIKQEILEPCEVVLTDSNPLSVIQLALIADEVKQRLEGYRPEFANIVRLHRNAGCRVHELFDSNRWSAVSNSTLQVKPQKGNALRVLQFSDIGFADADNFIPTYCDMMRLSERQYERAFSSIIREIGLWRLYEDGFARPSTHFFRHVKIKEMYMQGFEKEYIASWIGEKKVENLDYYLNSSYFV